MANVVYIGNYPSDFTDEDILKIFDDFEGVEFIRSVKKGIKCFSFLLCQDQEQVINVVLTLHDTEIGGRNLIVRASDDELQELIEEYDLEEEYYEETDEHSTEYTDEFSANGYHNYEPDPCCSSNNYFRQPRNPSRLVVREEANAVNNPTKKYFGTSVNEYKKEGSFSKKTSNKCGPKYQEGKVIPDSPPGFKALSRANKLAHDSSLDHFETASCASYSPSLRSFNTSPGSTVSSRYSSKGRCEKFSFVSINNFRNGTTLEELNELLAEFNPFKIIMKRPTSHDKDTLTEAIICFLKSKYATNAIMHLDNTLHKGRVLLVTECDDILELTELMKLRM